MLCKIEINNISTCDKEISQFKKLKNVEELTRRILNILNK